MGKKNYPFCWFIVQRNLKSYLDKKDPNHELIKFEMASFRHEIKELCKKKKKSLVKASWKVASQKIGGTIFYENKLALKLEFKTQVIGCIYDSDNKTVELFRLVDNKKTEVAVYPVDGVHFEIMKRFPKAKLVIKKKVL